jgi:hypothetical protein
LTGAAPFAGESVAAKLVAHQTGDVRPVHEVKATVPVELSSVIRKMMAKRPEDRFATPADAIPAFATWTQCPPPPPTEAELTTGREVPAPTKPAPSPAPAPRPAAARTASPSPKTGSGIRFYGDSSGAGKGNGNPAGAGVAAAPKVNTPPASDPITRSPHIFEPKPVLRQQPVALKASGDNLRGKPDDMKAKTPRPKRELPPALPVGGKKSSVALHEPASAVAPFAPPRKYSLRQRVAITIGVCVAVAVTAWSTVRVVAAGHRDTPAAQSTEPPARR